MRQMRTRHSSTLSRCKRWREPLEFLTRIGDRKAPINSRLLRIALVFPGRDCARERGFVGNTTVEALVLAEGFPVVGVQKTTILLWFRSSHRPLRGTPHDGGVHARLLPEVRRPPQAEAGRPNAMIQAPYHNNKSCLDVVIEEVVWL